MAEKIPNADPRSFDSDIEVLYTGTDNWLLKITNAYDMLSLNRHILEIKHINFDTPVQKFSSLPVRFQERDTLVQQLVDLVVYDTIIATVQRLQNFQTRYTTSDSAWSCAHWLLNRFYNI